jgi:hypothetical protein
LANGRVKSGRSRQMPIQSASDDAGHHGGGSPSGNLNSPSISQTTREVSCIINQQGDKMGAFIPGFSGLYSDPRIDELNGRTKAGDSGSDVSWFIMVCPHGCIGYESNQHNKPSSLLLCRIIAPE